MLESYSINISSIYYLLKYEKEYGKFMELINIKFVILNDFNTK